MNFVTVPSDPTITVADSAFVQNAWSNTDWLGLANDDDCGFYTTFLARPGVRKLNQQKIQVTVKQPGSGFIPTLFSLAFFGARSGSYDDATDTFTPFQPYFSMNNMNTMMLCDTLKSEMKNPSGLQAGLESKGVIPPPIEYASGGFYRENILHDNGLITPFDHVATIVKGNDVWTTHTIPMPMFPTYSDNFAAPDGVAIQGKIMIYFTTTNYANQIPPNPTDTPSLEFLNNTQIASFASPMQFL
jgi:hypothetical protein